MTAEQLRARLEVLKQEHDKALMACAALEGAMQEVIIWLNTLAVATAAAAAEAEKQEETGNATHTSH